MTVKPQTFKHCTVRTICKPWFNTACIHAWPFFFLLWMFSVPPVCLGQDDGLSALHPSEIGKREAKDPGLLVKALTNGKGSDREKFDAIFTWVASSINYNYSAYYSSASVPVSIPYILRTRSAICLGYATLMDTLCSRAGLTNVTVIGYAKDGIFDVNDSVYLDNHAWNAVKLDGLWYVYDVTWSSGHKDYKLKPAGSFAVSWLDKHPESFKRKKIRRRRRVHNDCGKAATGPAYYYKQRVLNEFLRKLVSRLPVKTGLVYTKMINTDYYLANPEVFTVTHIPADPIWTLGAGKNISGMEKDSAYYYQTDSVLKSQVRGGRNCEACDGFVAMTAKEQFNTFNERSAAFNAKNRFIRSYCEYYLAKEDYIESLGERTDSLHRQELLDSVGWHFQNAKQNMKVCKKDLSVEFTMQKNKNTKKYNLLIGENKQHLAFVRKKVKLTILQQQSFQELANKSGAFILAYDKDAGRIAHFKTHLNTEKLSDYPAKKVEAIEARLASQQATIDSLDLKISMQREAFDSLVYNLALNIWPQAFRHDSLIRPFYKGALLRRYKMDNYKKTVVDLRRHLQLTEQNYDHQVSYIIYEPALACARLFNSVYLLVKAKNALQQQCLSDQRELVKAKASTEATLELYRQQVLENRKLDMCWLASNYARLYSIHDGFEFIGTKQKQTADAINIENSIERERKGLVNEELKRRFQKHTGIASHNIRLVNLHIKDLKRHRKTLAKPPRKK